MIGSIAPNCPGHHGTVVARTVGTVAISCNDSFSDFHLLKKIEYKSSFIGNDYQTVGYLGEEVYNMTAYSLIYDFSVLLRVESSM